MADAAAVAGVEVVRLRLPDDVSAGLLHVEIQHGQLPCIWPCTLPVCLHKQERPDYLAAAGAMK